MPQDPKLDSSSLFAIEKIVGLIASEIDRRKASADKYDIEFLSDIHRTLKCVVDKELERQEKVAHQRKIDIALIEARGGFADRMRMSFLLSLLLAERGPVILSDEGIALIADSMLRPERARRRRAR